MALTQQEDKLARFALQSMLQTAIARGHIEAKGKTRAAIDKEFRRFLQRWLAAGGELMIGIDHQDALLSEARALLKANKSEFAIMFYATWVEHWVNRLILDRCHRSRIEERTAVAIVKETTFSAKFGWVLRLLGFPVLSSRHTKILFKLFEERNAFVHYKWRAFDDETDRRRDDGVNTLLQSIERTVSYLRAYERRHLYHGRKPKLPRLVGGRRRGLQK